MDQIKKQIEDELKVRLEEASEMEAGSDEQTKAVNNIEKLHKMKVEYEEAEARREDEAAKRKDSKVSMWVNVGTQVGLAAVGWALYAILHMKDLKFEETGTVSSQTGRNHWGLFKPKMKF